MSSKTLNISLSYLMYIFLILCRNISFFDNINFINLYATTSPNKSTLVKQNHTLNLTLNLICLPLLFYSKMVKQFNVNMNNNHVIWNIHNHLIWANFSFYIIYPYIVMVVIITFLFCAKCKITIFFHFKYIKHALK